MNLAAYLLLDAFRRDSDAAIVISNDSDLATPIFLCRKELRQRIAIFHPMRRNLNQAYWPSSLQHLSPLDAAKKLPKMSIDLKKTGARSEEISEAALQASQFPPTLTDAIGTLTKPVGW